MEMEQIKGCPYDMTNQGILMYSKAINEVLKTLVSMRALFLKDKRFNDLFICLNANVHIITNVRESIV